jgi:BirA family transcriptional regulator, biotin operon repressor / biotin---[acetyl-CoA-carboxylase] ligase
MRSASTDSLDAAAISAALGPRAREIEIDVVASCGSTNADLLAAPDSGVARLLAADYQSAGRGRHGRRWRSAPGTGICFSLRRRMRRPPRELAGARAVALKWPNDLLDAEGAKLGGILIETRLQGRSVVAVIGIGVNYRSNPDARVRRRTAALENLVRPLPSRNLLIAAMTRELLDVLDSFDASGLAPLREEWESLHAYAGQRVRLRLADGTIVAGIDAGVAEDGAMRVRTRDGVRALHSARVLSARPA